MSILVFDNYDSFTYNLVHILRELGHGNDLQVYRNDKITLEQIEEFDKILLSPGPGIPDEAGILKEVIRAYGPTKSILGVCLGHQAIAEVYGAQLYNMEEVLHGVASLIQVQDRQEPLFSGLPEQITVGRYHSWAVKPDSLSKDLRTIARVDSQEIMGIRHREFDVVGLQFHPESILTQHGIQIIENWLKTA